MERRSKRQRLIKNKWSEKIELARIFERNAVLRDRRAHRDSRNFVDYWQFLLSNLDPLILADGMDLRAIHVVGSDWWEEIGASVFWSDIVCIGLWI